MWLIVTCILVLDDIGILHIDYCGLHSNNILIYWVVGGTAFIAILGSGQNTPLDDGAQDGWRS